MLGLELIHVSRRGPRGVCHYHGCWYPDAKARPMGLLPDTQNCGLRMRHECRKRFPHHRLQRKPLVNDPGMHHCTCVTHVPWCMSRLLTRCGGENVPGLPGAFATLNFGYLERGPWPAWDSFLGPQLNIKTLFCRYKEWYFEYKAVLLVRHHYIEMACRTCLINHMLKSSDIFEVDFALHILKSALT